MTVQHATELRTRFAARLSKLYGERGARLQHARRGLPRGQPRVIARAGADAERLGSIDRVTAERHGAIRVGTPERARRGRPGLRRPRHVPRAGSTTCATRSGTRSRSSRPPSGPSTATSSRRTPSGCSPRCWSPRTAASSTRTSQRLEASWPLASCSPPSCSPWPTSPSRRGAVGGRCGPVPGPGRRGVRAVPGAGRPGLVHRARAHLRRRGRHRRGALDAHQPPHAPGARHRRAVRLHAGPRHRDDLRDPGAAEVGGPGRAAAPDLVPCAVGATHVPRRRR